jgi:hypothetical protein
MRDVDPSEYADRFIYIAALPKSGSSLMWLIASALQEPSGRADPGKMEGAPSNSFLPLNDETLKWFPRGGVYKNHGPVSFHTEHFLKNVGCKYIVLLRHPADHIAAYYCHARGEYASYLRGSITRPELEIPWVFGLGPSKREIFDPSGDIEQAICALVSDGYLFKVLEWTVDWLTYRNQNMSVVLTYEELMADFDATIARLSQFIRGRLPDEDVMAYLRHVVDAEAEKVRRDININKYPSDRNRNVEIRP